MANISDRLDWNVGSLMSVLARIYNSDTGEERVFNGPVLGVWGLRRAVKANEDAPFFGSRSKETVFCFKQKHMHFVSIERRTYMAMITNKGTVLSVREMGDVDDMNRLIRFMNQKRFDEYFARYIVTSRGKDVIALESSIDKSSVIFFPTSVYFTADEQPEQAELTMDQYVEFSNLSEYSAVAFAE